MAQYPGSIPSFTTKQDGVDYPQASHVNSPQDEITALATGLKNGLQHSLTVSTGGLTVSTGATVLGQSLSVAGGSTLADVTVTGTLAMTGAFAAPRSQACRVTHDATQAAPNASWVGLSWNGGVGSTAMHSTGANSSRVLLPSSGLWAIGAQVEWLGNATPLRQLRIAVNDSTGTVAGDIKGAVTIDPYPQHCAGLYLATSTTDYVTVQVNSNGSTGTVNPTGGQLGGSFFYALRVSG